MYLGLVWAGSVCMKPSHPNPIQIIVDQSGFNPAQYPIQPRTGPILGWVSIYKPQPNPHRGAASTQSLLGARFLDARSPNNSVVDS